jgi:hypothetical protein
MSGDLRIFIGTFNLGNAGPDLAFARDFVALAEGYDLVVIGYVNAERVSALLRTVAFYHSGSPTWFFAAPRPQGEK